MKTQNTLSIIFGTAFSLISIPFASIFTSFVLGIVGAIGAYIGTTFIKWIFGRIKRK